jgi:L-ribulose-5-phosphate 3-epimerase
MQFVSQRDFLLQYEGRRFCGVKRLRVFLATVGTHTVISKTLTNKAGNLQGRLQQRDIMRDHNIRFSRREMIRQSVQATAWLAVAANWAPLCAAPDKRRFRLGVCDFSIDKWGDPAGFEVAKQIGLDGVQVSLGSAADDMRLRKPEVQQQFKEAAKQTGLEVASLHIAQLLDIPYKSDPRAVQWVSDSIDVCKALGARVVLLGFFIKNDLLNDPPGMDEVVRRLKAVAPKAEKAGVVLGIESWLSADQHLELLERVGSKSVQVYYDVANSNERGYDIYKEIRKLGKHICEFHAKENGSLLGQGKVDFHKWRAALDDINYQGWVQIEGAVPPGQPMLESMRANCKFMRGILA